MVERIRFLIDASGEVQVSVEGAEGKSCEALTKPFEAILGVTATRVFKDSYYFENTSEEKATVERESE